MTNDFSRDGFRIVSECLRTALVQELHYELARLTGGSPARAGRRNLLRDSPLAAQVADSREVRALVEPVLGAEAFPVRAIFFDKTPEANWRVAWHQDVTIAVTGRVDVPGFGGWSIKDGVNHVQAPADVLETMLTVRLHLDDTGVENGPLLVIRGSHAGGKLDDAAIGRWESAGEVVECLVPAGGALLMRPLLLHSSLPSVRVGHRRVVHIEYAAGALPGGLNWHEETAVEANPSEAL